MAREMDSATSAAVGAQVLYPAWAVLLDILGDRVLVWTGIGPFSSDTTGDDIMDGQTFLGIANLGEIGAIVDGPSGSEEVTLSLPGVDLSDVALNQIVNDANRWQFRMAYIWLITMDSDGNVVGQPVRVKSGRMSSIVCKESDSGGSSNTTSGSMDGVVQVSIESHQAYASEALASRWSEQQQVDPSDLSQIYVYDLANKQATLGEVPSQAGLQDIAGQTANSFFN